MEVGAPHVAILALPYVGHLTPLSELAKLLQSRYGFDVTLLTVDNSPQVRSFMDALPGTITAVLLPQPSLRDLPPQSKIDCTVISHTMTRSLPSLREAMVHLKATTNLAALVVDVYAVDAFDVSEELGLDKYMIFPASATSLNFALHLLELNEAIEGEYRDHPELIRIPGCVPVHGRDLLEPAQDRKDEAYSWLLHHSTRYEEADGIIVNSSIALEPRPIREMSLMSTTKLNPVVYPIGPLIKMGNDEEDDSGCLEWLGKQAPSSVVYVSFGSGGNLPPEQLSELASGLEMSGKRFLWVVRSPVFTEDGALVEAMGSKEEDPLLFLNDDGFMERTKGVGMVVRSLAPQVAVLRHEATGGFLTHCGWNSTLESSVHGVPMIAWPQYAEQRMNSVLLSQEMKVAIRMRVDDENRGLVGREEISGAIKSLMEGEEGRRIRERVKSIQEEAMRELDDGGSSNMALDLIVNKWKKTVAN